MCSSLKEATVRIQCWDCIWCSYFDGFHFSTTSNLEGESSKQKCKRREGSLITLGIWEDLQFVIVSVVLWVGCIWRFPVSFLFQYIHVYVIACMIILCHCNQQLEDENSWFGSDITELHAIPLPYIILQRDFRLKSTAQWP